MSKSLSSELRSVKTTLCERLGIDLPIMQAPMGGAVGPTLAAAVSNAGGLGMLAPWRANIDTLRRLIRERRSLTSRPFGVNLVLEFPQEDRLTACLEERVPVISVFWGDPSSLVPRAKDGGAIAMHTVGSAAEAKASRELWCRYRCCPRMGGGRPRPRNGGDDAAHTRCCGRYFSDGL